jgi:preprotein translocase subunit SecD
VATIQAALGSSFRITGLSIGEARELSLLLRSGALAAPMYIVEERTVGASLGEENVSQGLTAGLIGTLLVAVCMIFNYRLLGLLSVVALAVNIMMVLALMSMVGVTLTMPGIAAIALTIGMAVDANVLIFCRIREELAQRSPAAAIHAGFDRAFITIADSNLTTFIIAAILFLIGSGPIKGFAVVLSIGLATSVFTAVLVTRALVNLVYGGRNVTKVSV